jgi:hypothetical protein
LQGERDCLRATVHPELQEDVLDVLLDGLRGDDEIVRDLHMVHSACEEPQDLELAPGEPSHDRTRDRARAFRKPLHPSQQLVEHEWFFSPRHRLVDLPQKSDAQCERPVNIASE